VAIRPQQHRGASSRTKGACERSAIILHYGIRPPSIRAASRLLIGRQNADDPKTSVETGTGGVGTNALLWFRTIKEQKSPLSTYLRT
jgi:hypothetical protein